MIAFAVGVGVGVAFAVASVLRVLPAGTFAPHHTFPIGDSPPALFRAWLSAFFPRYSHEVVA